MLKYGNQDIEQKSAACGRVNSELASTFALVRDLWAGSGSTQATVGIGDPEEKLVDFSRFPFARE